MMNKKQSTGAKQTDARATVAWLRDSEEFAFVRNSPQSQEAAAAAISDLEMVICCCIFMFYLIERFYDSILVARLCRCFWSIG